MTSDTPPAASPWLDATEVRRSDLCAALALEAATMLDLAEQAGFALKVTIDVIEPPVQIVVVGPPPLPR